MGLLEKNVLNRTRWDTREQPGQALQWHVDRTHVSPTAPTSEPRSLKEEVGDFGLEEDVADFVDHEQWVAPESG